LVEFLIVCVESLDSLSEDGDLIIFLCESFLQMGLLCIELGEVEFVRLETLVLFLQYGQLLFVSFKFDCCLVNL